MRKIFVTSIVSKLSLLIMAASAFASSIVTVGVPDQTPSIISVGEMEAAQIEASPEAVSAKETEIIAIGNSIIAVGPDAIPPSYEEVGAITEIADDAVSQAEWLATDAPLPLRISD